MPGIAKLPSFAIIGKGLLLYWFSLPLIRLAGTLAPPRVWRLSFWGAAFLLSCSGVHGGVNIPEIRAYRVGEKAECDIITPITLAIDQYDLVDQALVFVYDPNAVVEGEAKLRSIFNRRREQFLDSLLTASKSRKLTPQQTRHPGFVQLITWFQNQYKDFPLTAEIAELWATGEPDDLIQAEWSDALAEGMSPYLVSTLPSPSAKLHIITVDQREKLRELAPGSESTNASSYLRTVGDAKVQLIRRFLPEQPGAGKFVARFVKENCVFDQSLTAMAGRSVPTNDGSHHWYDAGQVIVRKGQTVDGPAKAAIDLLRIKREQALAEASAKWSEGLSSFGTQIKESLATAMSWCDAKWKENPRIALVALGVIALTASGWFVFRMTRTPPARRVVKKEPAYTVLFNAAGNETIFLPVKSESNPQLLLGPTAATRALPPPNGEPDTVIESPLQEPIGRVHIDWESRVEATERRAQELLGRVRAGLAPHLAKEMMSELVRRLISDRAGLLRTQNIASQEIAQFEQRFAKLHAQLQERLNHYQARNAELEKELQARTEQNRHLINSQIEALQKKVQ